MARRPLTPEDFQQAHGSLVTKALDDGDELVMTPGANAGAAAQEAGERYRATRADTEREVSQGTRESDVRPASWKPPSILPDVPVREGWAFRWVRLALRGVADDGNLNQAFEEGYVPATVEDVGNMLLSRRQSTIVPGGIEIGGLLLCKIPQEMREARERYYAEQAMAQVRGVENDMLRENDPRMPVLRPSVQSRTSFGASQSR